MSGLRQHKVNICDERPFRCHRCKKRFPVVAIADAHGEWHYEEDRVTLGLQRQVPVYACYFCPALLATAELGIAHMKAAHFGDDDESESENDEPLLSSSTTLSQPQSATSTVHNTIVAKNNNNDDDDDDDGIESEPRDLPRG